MASKEQFLKALANPYDRILFARDVLKPVFGSNFTLESELRPTREEPNKTEKQSIQSVGYYGTVQLDDGRAVTCYEVELMPNVRIEQSKVTIQQYVRKLLTAGQAALVNFVAPGDKTLWRFTLVAKDSEITEDGIQEKLTHAKRYTYLVEANRPNRTLAERLEKLGSAKEQNLDALTEAFSVEALSDAFFDEYKEHYQNFTEYLTGKRMVKEKGKWKEKKTGEPSAFLKSVFKGNEKSARDFCKKLMGRLVFLYFVQRKRWLGASNQQYKDGDPDFIFNLFQSSGGDDSFYPNWLSPLFFDTLNNNQRENEEYTLPDGTIVHIPFLNGGLFDKDKVDEKPLTFPAYLFHNSNNPDSPKERGFLDFLNAFNFTVYEDSPDDHTVAVDPEMLGHIFENLLEENKEKGAFYTPKEIVHFMCRESLIEYLTTHLEKEYTVYKEVGDHQVQLFGNDGKTGQLKMMEELGDKALNRADVERIVKEKDIADLTREQILRIDTLLESVKICDPAIGSGAFPMGLLQEIFSIKEIIAYELEQEWNAAGVKENIIQRSIYGVDIERGAVDIARLRFWLSLLVEEVKPRALPNFDYKIVVGNSLLSKFNGKPLEIDWTVRGGNEYEKEIVDLGNKIAKKQKNYFQSEKDKLKISDDIRDLKLDLLGAQLRLNKKKYEQITVKSGSLFGQTSKEKKKQEKVTSQFLEYKGIENEINELKNNKNKTLNYFDWRLDFPEVLNPHLNNQPGFDIVIANPPYLRVQEIQKTMPEDKKLLEKKFRNAKASYDLANLFFELAVTLGKPESSNCFIFPHKFFNSASTKVFRDYLFEGKYIDKIAHFGANMVFNDADTYTCIAFFSSRPNEGFWIQKFGLGENYKKLMEESDRYSFVPYSKLREASKLYGSNQWVLFNTDIEYDVFKKIHRSSIKLSKVFNIFVGLQTSKDTLYVLENVSVNGDFLNGEIFRGDQKVKVEKRFFKPLLKGNDIHRFESLDPDKYVFFPYKIENGRAKVIELKELKNNFPLTYNYVITNEREFKKRESGKAGKMKYWYEYIYPKNLTKFEQKKLSSMEICANHPNVTLDDYGFHHSTTVYSWVTKKEVKESYEFFLAIANSNLLWWFLLNTGDTLQGDARRFKSNYLNPFPLPEDISTETDQTFQNKVRHIMSEKSTGKDTTVLEKEIDAMVYRLYGLTYEEVKVVDEEFEMGREEYEKYKFE